MRCKLQVFPAKQTQRVNKHSILRNIGVGGKDVMDDPLNTMLSHGKGLYLPKRIPQQFLKVFNRRRCILEK